MRPSPGPTNIENISKKISSGIGALNRVRPFINTHSATKIHQALTLNDTRNHGQFHVEVVQKRQRNTYDPTHSCSFAYKSLLFFVFYICLFLLLRCCCFLLLLLLFFTFLLLSSRWIPQRIRKRR